MAKIMRLKSKCELNSELEIVGTLIGSMNGTYSAPPAKDPNFVCKVRVSNECTNVTPAPCRNKCLIEHGHSIKCRALI